MTRNVDCVFLGKQAPGLEQAPYPGELGQRIYDTISAEAWTQWLERLVMIINEYQLNSADPTNQIQIEMHLRSFLFGEGEYGQVPAGYKPK